MKISIKQIENLKQKFFYCDECNAVSEITEVKEIAQTFVVKNKKIELFIKARFCKKCGERLSDMELDDAALVSAYNEYRKNHKMLLPDDIKAIRDKYGLSAREFSAVMRFGDNTIYRYERGSLQDNSMDALIKFVSNPANMRFYLDNNDIKISEKTRGKLNNKINELMPKSIERVIVVYAKSKTENEGRKVIPFLSNVG